MALSGPIRSTTSFAALAAAMVTTFFAFVTFAGWVILQYGAKTTDYGWQAQRLGDAWFVSAVTAGGPGEGVLRPGDRIVEINADPISSDASLGLALRSIAASSLYTMKIFRQGQVRQLWLRAGSQAGFSFFKERLPLLLSSVVFFLAALAMLLDWNSMAARFGFLAAICSALRMGTWAILPLSTFFRQQDLHAYFVFWWPAWLALPFAYQAVLRLSADPAPAWPWRAAGVGLFAAWLAYACQMAVIGSAPAPVPEGIAYISWNRVEYHDAASWEVWAAPLFLAASLVLCGAWVVRLRRTALDPLVRKRAEWLIVAGAVFALPAAVFEILFWRGQGFADLRWSWLAAMMAVAFAYVVAAEELARPVALLRGALALLLPERYFAPLDRRYFPVQALAEEQLRTLAAAIESCRDIAQLQSTLQTGLQAALAPISLNWREDAPVEDLIELGPKRTGDPYTRRERKLIRRISENMLQAQERLQRLENRPADATVRAGALNLMRECPLCATCYDNEVVCCPLDQQVPVPTLPIERIIDGKYRLERRLGRGGMGAVYEGRDLRLDRRIAVKIMLSELFGQEAALRRFEREAQAAARLNHPNIIQIYDYGPIGATGAYLVMEYLEGRLWRDEIRDSAPIPATVCLPWIVQLLDGVEAAHRAGVVHRDLKPENLLLVGAPGDPVAVKILDFGLAKMHLLAFSRQEQLSLGITTIGTVGYAAPEQFTGGEADERSDIYAVGRIVLETVTGALSDEALDQAGEPLKSVLARASALKMDERYPDIASLRQALLPALEARMASEAALLG